MEFRSTTNLDRRREDAKDQAKLFLQILQSASRFSDELKTEVKVTTRQIQARWLSPELEARLDTWLKNAGLDQKWQVISSQDSRHDSSHDSSETDFAAISGSISEDPIETADPFRSELEDFEGRRARVCEKLSLLYRHRVAELLNSAKTARPKHGRMRGALRPRPV